MGEGAGSGSVRIEQVTKRFGGFVAVDDLSLTIPQGSFFALLGPSGCGKTTTLRMIAGLEDPTVGTIHLGDLNVTGVKPYKRPVNTVFQSYALFPHLTIFENVAFGLRRRKSSEVDRQVKEALDLVELGHLAGRKPGQLSGGQQQRIALARAIVNRPQVLLLDEPLGALDLKLRRQMQIELKRIQTEVGITFVHVTHDQEEAMTMADTVAVMNLGKIEQLGAPEELYENPKTSFVANFLGQSNLVHAQVKDTQLAAGLLVEAHGHSLLLDASRNAAGDSSELLIGVRPEKVRLVSAAASPNPGGELNVLPGGTVMDASFTGVSTQYLVHLPWEQNLTVFTQNHGGDERFRPGDRVSLTWATEHTFGLPVPATAG